MVESVTAAAISATPTGSELANGGDGSVEFTPSRGTMRVIRCKGVIVLLLALALPLPFFNSLGWLALVLALIFGSFALGRILGPIDGLTLYPTSRRAELARHWLTGASREIVAFDRFEMVGVVTYAGRGGRASIPFVKVEGRSNIELRGLGRGTSFQDVSNIADRISAITGAPRKAGGRGGTGDFIHNLFEKRNHTPTT